MKKKIQEKMLRLGRHIEHDPRSRKFEAQVAAKIVTVQHKHYGPPLDQGDLGSCTGNAMAQSLNSAPFHKPRKKLLLERSAVLIYSKATVIDGYPGSYPPDDTGSSGLAVMKVAKTLKLIAGYTHTFSLKHLLGALVLRPGILGINWYSSFDSPLETGECPLDQNAYVRGGHEIAMLGVDAQLKRVWCINSWGSWGLNGTGNFFFTWDTLGQLLSEQGDATFAVPIA
jgi:hypothetical protein